jgi:hypothetical protein
VSRESGPELDFTIDIDATYHLPCNADHAEALITVQARPGRAPGPGGRIAEILIMDRSLSMKSDHKVNEARRAAQAAIDALPDGALLAIIAGNENAARVFPLSPGLAAVDTETRKAAKRAVTGLLPEGGTRIGRWLTEASGLFSAAGLAPGTVRHAVLYTDGINQHESPAELDGALGTCADQFTCDARGLGNDWDYLQVRRIADRLHGEAEAVLRIEELAGDFTRLMRRVQRIAVPRAYLRLSPYGPFRVTSVAQVYPVEVDMTRHQRPVDGAVTDVPLGSWEARETRRYQVSLRFDPATIPTGEELRAVRVDLLAEAPDGTLVPCHDAPVTVFRHATSGGSITLPESLTQVHNQREIGLAIRACVNAWLNGRTTDADAELADALRLARATGDPRLPWLEDIAETGPDGRNRVRRNLGKGGMQKVGLQSYKTAYRADSGDSGPGGSGPGQSPALPGDAGLVCGRCGEPYEPDSAFCAECGYDLHDRGAT